VFSADDWFRTLVRGLSLLSVLLYSVVTLQTPELLLLLWWVSSNHASVIVHANSDHGNISLPVLRVRAVVPRCCNLQVSF
jgi:hypothetical protein